MKSEYKYRTCPLVPRRIDAAVIKLIYADYLETVTAVEADPSSAFHSFKLYPQHQQNVSLS